MSNLQFVTIRQRLSFCLALCALLLASACDEGGGSSHSDPASGTASASSTSSSTPSNTPPAPPPSGTAGVLEASWNPPTTNTDGSSLTDLAFYRLYYSNASAPCPGSAFLQIASPISSPQSSDTVTYTLTGLSVGTRYFVAVTAVDATDIESGCSSVASAVARGGSGGSASGAVGGIAHIGANDAGASASLEPVLTGLTAQSASQVPGTTVTFTAIATGGTAPYQFKWWLWDGATWTVLEDWSTANTLAWTPSTSNPNYAVAVRVRSASSTADQVDTGAYRVIAFAIN